MWNRIACTAGLTFASLAAAQPTAFTYQGQLRNGAELAGGLHDFRFSLFSAASGGTQIGTTQCVDNILVSEGLFAATVDFGQQFSTASPRFLQIEVRADTGLSCGNLAGFTILGQRQPITAAPLASHAKAATTAFSLSAPDGSPVNAVFVDNAGKVGIGTTAPALPLHIRAVSPAMILQDAAANSNQSGYVGFWNASQTETAWMGFGTPGSPHLSMVNARSGGNIEINPFFGSVGIGTSLPLARLDVRGSIRTNAGIRCDVTFGGPENLEIFTDAGVRVWTFGLRTLDTLNPGMFMISPVTGDSLAGIYRNGTSGGQLFADEKNFRVPNPADLSTDIWYCCPEGPEAAIYVRGTTRLQNGQAVIELPAHFRDLASEPAMTVQLTPLSAQSKGLAAVKKSLGGILVSELNGGTGDYEFDWRVEAVRKGHENYQVIRPWMASDADQDKAWQNRMRWVQERRAEGKP